MQPDPALVERFWGQLQKLTGGPPGKLGVAVSGGPDSLALLLLATAAFPGQVLAATVDHGLRRESAGEAAHVAAICADLRIGHATLTISWPKPPGGNIQARARQRRYQELAAWALDNALPFIATAHHVNDQAETVLMRLARGSGVAGLAGTRRLTTLTCRPAADRTVAIIRPLLDWSRDELAGIVAAAGLASLDDPSNADERYDRTRIRALLGDNPWIAPERLAHAAAHLADAEEALNWAARDLFPARLARQQDGSVTLNVIDLPRELQRRLLQGGLGFFEGCDDLPGPKLARLLDELRDGRPATLATVKATPGPPWRLERSPARRT